MTHPDILNEFSADIEALSVTVREGTLPEGWWGAYDHRKREIILLPGLGKVQLRSVLAHELGHAHFRHRGSTRGGEAQAEIWAAKRLIEPGSFSEAAKAGNWAGMVASELGVMPSDVVRFLQTLPDEEWLDMRDMLLMEPAGIQAEGIMSELTIADVNTGTGNYMLGQLQMRISADGSITANAWQEAIDEAVAFQRQMTE